MKNKPEDFKTRVSKNMVGAVILFLFAALIAMAMFKTKSMLGW